MTALPVASVADRPLVVIVEDDPAMARMFQFTAEAAGAESASFDDGSTALAWLLAMPPRRDRVVLLLDFHLPGLDGNSIQERLAAERADDFCVVFVSLNAPESAQIRALHLGAVDFVTKPINFRLFQAKLRVWLRFAGRG